MSNSKEALLRKALGRGSTCATAIVVAVAMAGCGSGSGTTSNSGSDTSPSSATPRSTLAPAKAATAATIRLQNIAIKPAKVTVQRGATVTWRWLDGHIDTAHNVTSQPGALQFNPSGTRLTGSYSIRFDKPGKYFYECTIHPASMQGEIVVE